MLCTIAGYFLGKLPFVQQNFEKVLLGIIVLSLVPAVLEFRKARARSASV